MKPKDIKICMNAMVKNEANTISRMLESCYQHIDYWVVQDNGSTDGTQEIIRNFFLEKNIPGFLYEIDWQYPGWNRDHTLQKALTAPHGCDWILRMDADEQLVISNDFDWNVLRDTSVQSWNIFADAGNFLYFRTWLWNAKLPWFFAHDKRHECIHLPEVGENFQRVSLPMSFKHLITNDGMTWTKPMKFLVDALELELDKVPSNKVLEDPYHLWYIGKSYSDAFGDVSQFPFKEYHAKEYARRSIFYFEMYLNTTHNWYVERAPSQLDDMGYYALVLMGRAHKFLGNYDEAIKCLSSAYRFSPNRNENFVAIAEIYQELKQYRNMLAICNVYLNGERTNPFPHQSFFIDKNCYADTSTYPAELKKFAEDKIKNV